MWTVKSKTRRGNLPAAAHKHKGEGVCRVLAHGVILTGLAAVSVLAVPAGFLFLLILGIWSAVDWCAGKLESSTK